jgi:Flp pilus assembly protein TadD
MLVGTDLREVDLTGARLDPNALEQAHWSGAIGLLKRTQSHAALHNAGVTATESDLWSDAEELFGLAILKQPQSAESWVARGISREQLGKRLLAIQDFNYASQLYTQNGEIEAAEQLTVAALSLQDKPNNQRSGNGAGSAVLNGLLSTSQALLPLAMKLFLPAL